MDNRSLPTRNTAQPGEGAFSDGSRARPAYLEFGWNAAPFAQQLPGLDPIDAEHFDKDNAAIIRLHLRGFITDGERDRAINRVTRDVRAKLASPLPSTARRDGR